LGGRLRIVLILVIWLATVGVLALWATGGQTTRISLGGGPAGSETFALATAIATVLNRDNGSFHIDVFETGGSTENLALVQSGQLDLGTAQADMVIPDGILGVASLYHDAYHLIVNSETSIHSFADLAGHRIAIPPRSSGQNESFWFLAEHYRLDPSEFIALPMAEEAANFAMIHGQVDAVFRVRAPGNNMIRELIGDHAMRLVPIGQSSALSLKQPAIRTGRIPQGSYRGSPALPVTDLDTAVLERLLIVRAEMAPDIVYKITRGIFDRRSDLVSNNKLAGLISPLGEDSSGVIPAHPGARRYYDREKPGLLQQNARLASAGLYMLVIVCSGFLALRSNWLKRRRVRMSLMKTRRGSNEAFPPVFPATLAALRCLWKLTTHGSRISRSASAHRLEQR